jgi:hypothetical protein
MPYLAFEMKDAFNEMSECLSKVSKSGMELKEAVDKERQMTPAVGEIEQLGIPNGQRDEGQGTRHDGKRTAFDKKLIRAYFKRGFHPRRSLDQYHYHMVDDTKVRDGDQVVDRWAVNAKRIKTCLWMNPLRRISWS